MKTRAQKAIEFMLRNEDYRWDSRAVLENLNDGAGLTFVGLTERDDTKYLPPECPAIKALAALYKTDKARAIEIIIQTYIKAYWNPKYDDLISERLAIRLFDLGVNMYPATAVKLLQRGLNDLGAHLVVDGQFGIGTLSAANHYSLAGDDLHAAIDKNVDLFLSIFGKMKELVDDVRNFDFAEFTADLKEIGRMAQTIFGKMIDEDVLKEIVGEAKERYEGIAQKPRFTRFLAGWLNRLKKDEYDVR